MSVGTTTLKVLFHPADAESNDSDSDVEDRVSSQDDVVTCKFPESTKLIPLDDMFIPQNYKLKHETRTQLIGTYEWSSTDRMGNR